jgi:hypothetical protein
MTFSHDWSLLMKAHMPEPCDCVERINAEPYMIERNTAIELPMFGPQRALVRTMKRDEKVRKKPSLMFATHCPFCGSKYPEEAA